MSEGAKSIGANGGGATLGGAISLLCKNRAWPRSALSGSCVAKMAC